MNRERRVPLSVLFVLSDLKPKYALPKRRQPARDSVALRLVVRRSVRRGLGVDGVEDAGGINQRGAGVHADGNAQSFRDFFPRRAGLQSRIRVKHDATIAAGRNGNCQRNELARLLTELGRLGIRAIESQVSPQSVGRQFAEFADAGADILVILIPVHDHIFSPMPAIFRTAIGVGLYSPTHECDIFSSSSWPASDRGAMAERRNSFLSCPQKASGDVPDAPLQR